MASLLVFLNGKKQYELKLEPGREFIVGRGENCDLVLEAERGISRQHLKISSQEGQWVVEVLSRYGELYQDGNKINSIQLQEGTRFEVPPYEFRFESAAAVKFDDERTPVAQAGSVDLSERTFVGAVVVLPFLRVCDSNGDLVQIFQLDGHAWVAGRDVSCNLFIDNPKFSRRHFEIRFEEGAYLLKDLGSSNGTLLNGENVGTDTWTQLKSGDAITVVDWTLYFELRDSNFDAKLQEIPQELQLPVFYSNEIHPSPAHYLDSAPDAGFASGVPPMPPPPAAVAPAKKVNWVRMAIYLVLVGSGVFYFLGNSGSNKQTAEGTAEKSMANPFEKLSPQQQQYVKDTYRLADRLFKEGRYEMARQEVAKVHQLVPNYEESRNLEKLSDIAIQTQVEQQKAEVREREMAEMEDKIQKTVAECRKLITPRVQIKQLEDCLGPVVPLNPDHASILQLREQAEQVIAEQAMNREKQADYLSRVRKLQSQYEKANRFLKDGKPLEAIPAFEAVVKSSHPDPQKLKPAAQRQIASIQRNLISKQAELEKVADEAQRKGELKLAIQTLQKALQVNPENETIKGRINSMLGELRKQMQTLYQEGVLEESVGEVETAKARWKKIINTSIPEEDYYKKAKIKLKKYGAE